MHDNKDEYGMEVWHKYDIFHIEGNPAGYTAEGKIWRGNIKTHKRFIEKT